MQDHYNRDRVEPIDPVGLVDLVFLMRTLIATEFLW